MQIACWNFKIPNQQDPVACLSSYDRCYSSKLFAIDMTVDGRNDSFIMFSTRVPPVEKFAMCITVIYRCIDCGWYPAECSWQRERQVEPWGCCLHRAEMWLCVLQLVCIYTGTDLSERRFTFSRKSHSFGNASVFNHFLSFIFDIMLIIKLFNKKKKIFLMGIFQGNNITIIFIIFLINQIVYI